MATAGTRTGGGTVDPSTNGGAPEPDPSRRSRRAALGAVGALALVGAAVAVTLSGGDDEAATPAASQATRTAEVVRQDLVERESVDGTLGYSDARTVVNRLSGTVTWTPATGSVVRTNQRLFEVEGTPVYLLDGSYPAYRTLRSGLTGDDVRQLERNLRVLGLDPDGDMKVDGTWDSGTTEAVKRWQERKGMEQDGSIEKGRIVFQPGSRRIGAIELRAGDSASGGGGGASGGGGSAATAPASFDATSGSTTVFASQRVTRPRSSGFSDIPTARAAQDTQTTTTTTTTTPPTTTTTPTATTPPTVTTTPTTPAATPAPAPTSPEPSQPTVAPSAAAPSGSSRSGMPSGAAPNGGGGTGAPATATAASSDTGSGADVASELMTTTSTKRIVAVDLETTDQELASEGDAVEVELPGGDEVEGTIARVGKVAQKKASSQDEDPPATIKVVIKLTKSTGTRLDQAPVDVQLQRSRAEDVLTVPVTALLARSGGTFAVEVREGDARRVVPVTTGLYTDGYVEVEGAGLREGMIVTDAGV